MTANLLALSDWLTSLAVNEIALESTACMAAGFQHPGRESRNIVLVNPQHIKHVRGRKTEVKDAEWLADLLRHGLLQASSRPLLFANCAS